MSQLQHEQIEVLCEELKLQVVANQYAELAQTAATSESSYVSFLVDILKAERIKQRLFCKFVITPSKAC